MYLCYYSGFGPRRKSAAAQDFRPEGRRANENNGIRYGPCLHCIVHILFQTCPIPRINFFKKLFSRKADCSNMAASLHKPPNLCCARQRSSAALIFQNRSRENVIWSAQSQPARQRFFFSAAGRGRLLSFKLKQNRVDNLRGFTSVLSALCLSVWLFNN